MDYLFNSIIAKYFKREYATVYGMLHYKYRSIIIPRHDTIKSVKKDLIEMKIDELRRKMIKPEAQPISSFDMTNQQKQFNHVQ